MNSIDQTTRNADSVGVAGLLRSTLKTGLGVAENMHQFAVEIPLNMLKVVGVSDEQTSALKDKHRGLLRGMYGSIDSVASQMTEVGERQATLLADGIRKLAESGKTVAEKKPLKAAAKSKPAKAVAKAAKTAKEEVKTVKEEVSKAVA